MVNCINLIIEMSPRFVLGRENVPCVAEAVNRRVNRSLKADWTDFTVNVRALEYRMKFRIQDAMSHDSHMTLKRNKGTKLGALFTVGKDFLLLSEGRRVIQCISECHQSGRRVVFDPLLLCQQLSAA